MTSTAKCYWYTVWDLIDREKNDDDDDDADDDADDAG